MDRNTIVHLPIFGGRKNIRRETDLPIFFLGGPIRNAPSWQVEAIRFLLVKNKKIFIASPTRKIDPDLISSLEIDLSECETFGRQRAWEQYYLYGAAKKGCVIFWLAAEAEEKEFSDKVYAHITMMELG